MIDVRQGQAMVSGLRFLARTIAKAETPAWHNNVYQNDQPQSYDNFESDFGIPENFDLNTSAELVFPPPENSQGVILSEGDAPCAAPKSKDPFVWAYRTGTAQTIPGNLPDPPPLPHSGNFCADHNSTACDCMLIRADFPVTPEAVEIIEVSETLGSDAAALRARQLERNRQRRELRTDRKRYAARAQELNIRRAADILAQRKLAAQKLGDEKLAPPRSQAQTSESDLTTKKPPSAATVAGPPLTEVKSTA